MTEKHNNYSTGQKERWANMSAEERASVQAAMKAGQKKARQKKTMSSKKSIDNMNNKFEIAKKLSVVMALAGGRENVIRLMDIVELFQEEQG